MDIVHEGRSKGNKPMLTALSTPVYMIPGPLPLSPSLLGEGSFCCYIDQMFDDFLDHMEGTGIIRREDLPAGRSAPQKRCRRCPFGIYRAMMLWIAPGRRPGAERRSMTEWTVVSVLIAVAGSFLAVGRPVIALNSTITKLQTMVESLAKKTDEYRSSNSQSHRRIFETLEKHDGRIMRLEVKDLHEKEDRSFGSRS